MVIIGAIVVLVLLLTNGIIGGAFCLRGVGCIYSSENGVRLDNSSNVRVNIGTPAP